MTPTTLEIEGGLLAVTAPGPTGVRCFKGIPYARPPVGDLRWRPPQPVAPWTGVRKADAFGPNSMQGVVFGDIDPRPAGVSEDCLYLNVWTPALEAASASPGHGVDSRRRLRRRLGRRAPLRRDQSRAHGASSSSRSTIGSMRLASWRIPN